MYGLYYLSEAFCLDYRALLTSNHEVLLGQDKQHAVFPANESIRLVTILRIRTNYKFSTPDYFWMILNDILNNNI